jgi:hypothetical protein
MTGAAHATAVMLGAIAATPTLTTTLKPRLRQAPAG